MGKRLLIFITVLLIAGIVTGWYFFARESRYFGTSPLRAVPVDAPFFVRIRNLGDFAAKTVKNGSWQSLCTVPEISGFYRDFVFIDSLIRQNNEYGNFLRKKELIMVPMDSSKLFLLEIGSIPEKNSTNTIIRNYFQSRNIIATGLNYKDAEIQQYEWTEKGELRRILITFYKGMLMIGDEAMHIQKALEQMEHPSVLEDSGYLMIDKNTTENSNLNIYFNHKTLPAWLSRFYADSTSAGLLQHDYAKWTEVDVIQKEYQLLINGFTVTDTTRAYYLDIYRHQKPLACTLQQLMPSFTTYFADLNLSDPVRYLEDYKNYLQKKGGSDQSGELLSSLSKELKLDVRQYLSENWTGEAAAVFTTTNMDNQSDNRYLLVKVKKGMNDPMGTALKKRFAAGKSNLTDSESADAGRDNIYEMPCGKFGNLLAESSFGSVQTKWITVGDGFLLMGASPGSLRRYLASLRNNELLAVKSSYIKLTSGLARSSNFYVWCDPGQTLPFFEQVIKPEPFLRLKDVAKVLGRVENIAWQWGYEKGMVYNTACINVNPSAVQTQVPFWKYPLKTKLRNKPVFVRFSDRSTAKELVFQDIDNNLTDIDRDGIERWKIRLEAPVIGEIKIVDFFKNGEFQLLFNTSDAIHLVNRHGTEIRNFPVRLKSGATNEISVFDYDGKKDYRYLVACRDRKVYNFDKYGKPVTGWQAKATPTNVEKPVRHFRVGSRDYIVFSDRNHTYVLDRQGKERVKFADDFVHSGNKISLIKRKDGSSCMVTTDEQGKIRVLGFDGSMKKISAGNFSSSHNFMPMSTGGENVFLFLDKHMISAYDFSGKLVFSNPVKGLSDESATLSADVSGEFIELYQFTANRSTLLRKDGSVFDTNLPDGYTLLTVGSFDDKSGASNVLSSDSAGFLSNFQMILK